jgi:hypothetical protein
VARSGGRGALIGLSAWRRVELHTCARRRRAGQQLRRGYDFAHLDDGRHRSRGIIRGPQSAPARGGHRRGCAVITRRGGAPRIDGLIEAAGGTARATVAPPAAGAPGHGLGAEHLSDGERDDRQRQRISNDDYTRSPRAARWGSRKPGARFALTGALLKTGAAFRTVGFRPSGVSRNRSRVARTNDTRRIGVRLGIHGRRAFVSASGRLRRPGERLSARRTFVERHVDSMRACGRLALDRTWASRRAASWSTSAGAARTSWECRQPAPDRPPGRGPLEKRVGSQSRTNITAGARLEHIVRDDVERIGGLPCARRSGGRSSPRSIRRSRSLPPHATLTA